MPFLIALILYKKFYRNNALTFDVFLMQLQSLGWYWFLFLPLCSALNWGLEVRKWQFLVNKLEPLSYKTAIKSVLSGVAVSQLLPYRTGEYLGRLAYVGDENKINAGILSVAGSFSQLLITLVFGLAAFVYIHPLDYPLSFTLSFAGLMVLLLLGYFYMPQFNTLRRLSFFATIRKALHLLTRSDLLRLLTWSGLRYFSFLLPYALLAMHFKVGDNNALWYLMTAVSCIYFLQTVSPNFILTDIAIRISVPALVFSGSFEAVNNMDFMPGMLVYVFNVLLPMLAGAFILLTLKLKR